MIARYVYVMCARCCKPCGGTQDLRDDYRAARRLATSRGWKVRRNAYGALEDVCPDCDKAEVPA